MSLSHARALPDPDLADERPPAGARTSEERCPWCDQAIPHEKFAHISNRIAEKERAQHAAMTAKLKEDFAHEKALMAAQVREEARLEAEAALTAWLEAAEAARLAAETLVAQQREALQQEKTVAVQAEQLKAYEERQKLQQKLELLQKQIENKTAQEIGEGPEADLFEVLRAAFEGDRIRRVAKGLSGADVIHEIVRNGQVCGKIVYDSKSRNAWKNEYVTKLRADQMVERAEHAILSCNKLPQGAQQIHVQEGVIVAHPQRVVVLAQILRRHVIETHELRVGNEQREEKTAELYAFITSDRCKQLFEQIALQAQRMLELEAAEERAHKVTWERRGKLIRSVQKVHNDLCFEIERVIGTGDGEAGGGSNDDEMP